MLNVSELTNDQLRAIVRQSAHVLKQLDFWSSAQTDGFGERHAEIHSLSHELVADTFCEPADDDDSFFGSIADWELDLSELTLTDLVHAADELARRLDAGCAQRLAN